MVLGELMGYIAIVIVIILINAEIKFRQLTKYYKNLGYKHPEEQASRAYCVFVSVIQIAPLIAFLVLIWVLITHWNDTIYFNN